ncbi:MAG: 2-hydroxyacyl-CoA dehydratase [Deltaproteobacteria bacterium]|nr:2-hydroxyacyl-CoA dehydratase [Deltaproteobacteria bacterium]
MYSKLLEMCGFDPQEITKEKDRIEKTFKILGMGEKEFAAAEKRVKQLYSIELPCVRMMLKVWIKELIALVMAGEEKEKIVYAIMPSPAESYLAAMLASDKLYVGYPDYVFQIGLGAIFGNLTPLLEAAEKNGMPPGGGHCGLNKTRLGAHALGIIPKGDLSMAWGIVCDEGPKTDELIHEVFDTPIVYLDRCQDDPLDLFPEINELTVDYMVGEIKRAYAQFAEVSGVEITNELVMKAVGTLLGYMEWLGKVQELMRSDPLPLSQADMILFIMVTQLCIRDYETATEAVKMLHEEVAQRVKDKRGVLPEGAPRVLWGNHFPLPDPGIVKMVEEIGIASPLSEIWYITTQPPTKLYDDPVETIARRFLELGLLTSVTGRAKDVVRLFKNWNLDGILWFNHSPCKVIGTDSLMIKKALKKELKVPIIVVEGDIYDSRFYNRQQMKTRVESFAEMFKTNKKGIR